MVAQVAALDHQGAFSALILVGTRLVGPGLPDPDLPDHDRATMSRLLAHSMPHWADREAVVEFAAAGAEILGDDPVRRGCGRRAHLGPHTRHRTCDPDGQPAGHGLRHARLRTPLA
jgi:hypothetical protein